MISRRAVVLVVASLAVSISGTYVMSQPDSGLPSSENQIDTTLPPTATPTDQPRAAASAPTETSQTTETEPPTEPETGPTEPLTANPPVECDTCSDGDASGSDPVVNAGGGENPGGVSGGVDNNGSELD